jgi:hypothetical protein
MKKLFLAQFSHYLYYRRIYSIYLTKNNGNMKKFLFLIIAIFISFAIYSQDPSQEMSNYEKYVLAKEQAENSPDTVYKTDTIFIDTPAEEPVVINNYYLDYDPGFSYSVIFGRSYYRPYYDPFYYRYSYYSYYPYYPYRYSYWGYDYYRYNYHPYHYYNYSNNYRSSGYRSRYINSPVSVKKDPIYVNRTVQIDRNTNRVVNTTRPSSRVQTTRSSDKSPYTRVLQDNGRTSTRSYTPSYQKPVAKTRPDYNRTNVQRPSTPRESGSYSRPSSSSTPQKNYSTPTQSRSSSTYQRSSSSGSSSGSANRNYSSSGSSSTSRSSSGRR